MPGDSLKDAAGEVLSGDGGVLADSLGARAVLADSAGFAGEALDPTGTLVLLLFKVLLVFVVFALLFWLLRLARGGRIPGFGRLRSVPRPLQVLSALSLGARRQAVLLRVQGRVILLGVGEGGIRSLARFQGEEARGLIEACRQVSGGSRKPFRVELERRRGEPDADRER